MPEPWAIAGVDLHLDLAGRNRRCGLERALREAIQSGRLRPGTRLPSSRALAADLGIARNTVADAFGQLVAEGWLVAQTGSGTRVSNRAIASDVVRPERGPARVLPYSLMPGTPDLSAFPRSAWLAAARRALIAAPSEALGYSDPRGRPELRDALAGYLARTRGVRTTSERIVVCTGFMQGLALLSTTLTTSGPATLVVEAFGHRVYRDAAEARGVRVRTVPIDGEGAVLDGLGPADAVLLTPAHQYPIGVTLSAHRRRQVVEWAAAGNRLVIEDDYDGEFRYDRQPIGAVQPLAPEQVVYAGTASKTLVPGLRLGWLVLPDRLVEPVSAARLLADHAGNTLDQLTMAEFISSGAYDRHIRRCRLAYRRRRDRLTNHLREHAPGARVTGDASGLHVLVQLADGVSEAEAIARAAERGLAVQGLAEYATTESHAPALVIGFAAPAEHAFTGAIGRLSAALTATR
ncbi:MAG: PLP-dependent aminotransferase family protein [Jatrophihabitans sp.]